MEVKKRATEKRPSSRVATSEPRVFSGDSFCSGGGENMETVGFVFVPDVDDLETKSAGGPTHWSHQHREKQTNWYQVEDNQRKNLC